MQVTLVVLIILLSRTETPTTGGFETLFIQKSSNYFQQETLLIISVGWSLLSCVKLHTSLISTEKQFCPMFSKMVIFTWGTFATLRRVLQLTAFFTPSLGLFSLLHHWKFEQIPFRIRQDFAKTYTVRADSKIHLFGLNDTVYWSELDRWNYSDPANPAPPPLSHYTLMSLRNTFIYLICLSLIQFLLVFTVKFWTSEPFREETHLTNMIIHSVENLNLSTPYKDWDQWNKFSILGCHGKPTIQELTGRFKDLRKEMTAIFTVNFVFTILMMIPLWYLRKYYI